MVKYYSCATARYSGRGEKLEKPPFLVFLTQIYQWFTNISGEPGLAIIIYEMKRLSGKNTEGSLILLYKNFQIVTEKSGYLVNIYK